MLQIVRLIVLERNSAANLW